MQEVKFGKIRSGKEADKNRDWMGDNAHWYIQEKMDGSQLSFCFDATSDCLRFFNRGKEKNAPYQKIFLRTITALTKRLKNVEVDLVFHGEAIGSLKHNVSIYKRVPRYGFVLFGVQRNGEYLDCGELRKVAIKYDLELAQIIYENDGDETVNPCDKISTLMDTRIESQLGGDAEGLVLKHHRFTNPKGKMVTCKVKYVYSEFKEVHRKKQQTKVVLTPDIFLCDLGSWFNQDAWMSKAVFRLRDNDKIDPQCEDLQQRKRDGVRVEREMIRDITEECEDMLREELWQYFGPLVIKRVVNGASEKYFKLK
jgi:hypothetical protein